jgi:hypothetical protein
MGWKGQDMPDGVLRFTLSPTLGVAISGIATRPNLALDGYAAFKAQGSQILMAVEIVAKDETADKVVRTLSGGGVEVTALHNHLLRESPRIKYVHGNGVGDPVKLAQAVKAAVAVSGLPVSKDDDSKDKDDTAPNLDVSALEAIIKQQSQAVDGVLEFSIDRTDRFTLDGHVFPPAMGPAHELHFQGLGGHRAIAVAEFALLADEVPLAIAELRAHGAGVEIEAVHNHWLEEAPRLFFVHVTGVGNELDLARTFRAVLDRIGA